MTKRLKLLFMIIYSLGFVLLTGAGILRNELSDFALGFLEGLAVVFIIAGFCYIVWCFFHKENPFKVEQ